MRFHKMFPWKYLRAVLKLGTTAKCLLLLLLVITPFLMILVIARHEDSTNQADTKRRGLGLPGTKIDTDDSFNKKIGERFAKRRQHLHEECAVQERYYATQNSENAVKEHLTIDQKHKLVYCAIEKIGSTFWKRVYQILSGFRNVSDPFEIKGIRAYEGYITAKGMPFDKIHMILKASEKFIFVREPYERLLSGYVDKLFAPNAAYWSFIGTFIVKEFRKDSPESSKSCGHDITFAEFVRYFIHSQEKNIKRDAHFVPNFEHCRPCEIDYDYIGKLETFREDTMYLFKKFEIDKLVQFTDFQKETETDAIVDAADYVFSMKNAITRCMTLTEALYRGYRKLQIRGIISNEIPFPFPRNSPRNITIVEYKHALLKAHAHSGSTASRRANRKEAFLEAYATLPHDLMMKLTDVLSMDAHLFGYEVYPKSLENINSFSPNFKYFEL